MRFNQGINDGEENTESHTCVIDVMREESENKM